MTLYTDRKPREAVARAIYEARNGAGCKPWSRLTWLHRDAYRDDALAVLNTLRELGFITSEGLDAIHAEEDANGEPRSSVVPRSGR